MDKWNIRKKELNEITFRSFFHEREVWWCALGVNIGSEQDGKNELFERPVLIIKKLKMDLVLIIPITTKINKEHKDRINIQIAGQEAQLILQHVRTVSIKRLLRRICHLKTSAFQETILKLVRFILFVESETPP